MQLTQDLPQIGFRAADFSATSIGATIQIFKGVIEVSKKVLFGSALTLFMLSCATSYAFHNDEESHRGELRHKSDQNSLIGLGPQMIAKSYSCNLRINGGGRLRLKFADGKVGDGKNSAQYRVHKSRVSIKARRGTININPNGRLTNRAGRNSGRITAILRKLAKLRDPRPGKIIFIQNRMLRVGGTTSLSRVRSILLKKSRRHTGVSDS